MRHHQGKATQLELFGSAGSATIATPEWRNLPHQTRQTIIGLMARLLMEHDREQRTERGEDHAPAATIGEDGDV
ncbi:MAG: hypothetical protein GY788_11140 [bacterium]|nr:hypothetical protein [bacterium]